MHRAPFPVPLSASSPPLGARNHFPPHECAGINFFSPLLPLRAPAALRVVNLRANIQIVYGPFLKIKTCCTLNRMINALCRDSWARRIAGRAGRVQGCRSVRVRARWVFERKYLRHPGAVRILEVIQEPTFCLFLDALPAASLALVK